MAATFRLAYKVVGSFKELTRRRPHFPEPKHRTARPDFTGLESIEADNQPNLSAEIEKELERLKWNLWHGNVHKALQIVEDLEYALDLEANSQEQRKLLKAVREFGTYITANRTFIPNYGDRYWHGETISTGFVASAINQVVSKRMVKKQQMRWTDRGAHLLLQVRTRVLNED
jgi:hypothetical protein